MKLVVRIAAMLCALALGGCSYFKNTEGLTVLFAGKDSGTFVRVGDAQWRLADGVLGADAGTGFLVTKETFRDFQLHVELYVEADTHAGIFLRCDNAANPSAQECYEVSAWDRRPSPEFRTGAIVDVAKASAPATAGGKWNTFEITAKGDQIVVVVNGTKTAEAHDARHREGPIALMRSGGAADDKAPLRVRRIEVRRL